MNVTTMRRIDRWLGIPACMLLTLWCKLTGGGRMPATMTPGRILFVKLAEQGSTVLAYRTLCRAVEMVGRENVFFVVFAENRFILDLLKVVPQENIIPISTRSLLAAISGALKAVVRMRRKKIDTAIDLEFFARSSAALCYLSGARWRSGLHTCSEGPYRGDLMTHRVSFNPHLHTSLTFLSLVEALNQPPSRLPAFDLLLGQAEETLPVFVPQPNDVEQVRAMLPPDVGSGRSRLVLMNCNASDLLPLRRWPPERYVALAEKVLQKYPTLHVGFTGSPCETKVVEKLVAQVRSERCHCLAGKTTLSQLVTLYTLADILVTNDSGPAHFAALTNMHVITLFGPETPALFAARTPRNHVLWSGLVCSPCVNAFNNRYSGCKDNICIKRITVEQIFDELCRIYERGSAVDRPSAKAANV
jgi:ADP-heptose:LPS heptosyltransferase